MYKVENRNGKKSTHTYTHIFKQSPSSIPPPFSIHLSYYFIIYNSKQLEKPQKNWAKEREVGLEKVCLLFIVFSAGARNKRKATMKIGRNTPGFIQLHPKKSLLIYFNLKYHILAVP